MRLLNALLRRFGLLVAAFVGLTALAVILRGAGPVSHTAFMADFGRALAAERGHRVTLVHQWVPAARIAPEMRLAAVAAEDQKFPHHHGFDWEAIEKAWKRNQQGRAVHGASTISQQTARNLFLWPDRTWLRKGLEAWFTLLIETFWSKSRILTVYLNSAQFDTQVFGVEAAAHRFFGVSAADLSVSQAALLAAQLPAPDAYRILAPSAYIRRRQAWIEAQMAQLGSDYLASP